MFNNFIKKIKLNLLTIKNKFLFFVKLINLNLFFNLFYFYVICDCFISIKNHTPFLLQFFNNIIFFVNPISNLFFFIFFYFFLSLRIVILNFLKNFSNSKFNKIYNTTLTLHTTSYNAIYLQFLYYLYNKTSFIVNLNYLYYWYINFFNYYLFNNYLFRFIINNIYLNKPLYWYTIFKRHSIFGFYRSNRQTWTELKSEEVNYIKY